MICVFYYSFDTAKYYIFSTSKSHAMGRDVSAPQFHVNFGSGRVGSLHLWVGFRRLMKIGATSNSARSWTERACAHCTVSSIHAPTMACTDGLTCVLLFWQIKYDDDEL